MQLIFFVLVLIAAALMFPEGTRGFVVFVAKATAVIAIVGLMLAVALSGIGGAIKATSTEPVKKISDLAYSPSRTLTLSDGTKVTTNSGWVTASGDFIDEEEDAERVRLYKAGLGAIETAKK